MHCSKTTKQLIEKFLIGGLLSPEELYQIRQHTIQFIAESQERDALRCFSSGGTADGILEVYGIDIKETLKAFFINPEGLLTQRNQEIIERLKPQTDDYQHYYFSVKNFYVILYLFDFVDDKLCQRILEFLDIV